MRKRISDRKLAEIRKAIEMVDSQKIPIVRFLKPDLIGFSVCDIFQIGRYKVRMAVYTANEKPTSMAQITIIEDIY